MVFACFVVVFYAIMNHVNDETVDLLTTLAIFFFGFKKEIRECSGSEVWNFRSALEEIHTYRIAPG